MWWLCGNVTQAHKKQTDRFGSPQIFVDLGFSEIPVSDCNPSEVLQYIGQCSNAIQFTIRLLVAMYFKVLKCERRHRIAEVVSFKSQPSFFKKNVQQCVLARISYSLQDVYNQHTQYGDVYLITWPP